MATSSGSDASAGLPGRFRAEFPITASRAYLFSGGLAPAPRRASTAVGEWVDGWSLDPAVLWEHLLDATEAVRDRLARLLRCDPGNVAITDGTSRASNLAVALIDHSPGANVVVDATTYPSSLYPWLVRRSAGIEVRRASSGRAGLAADLADLDPLVDERTVAVSVSHVDPLTGVRHDLRPLAELAHARGALLVLDVAQSAGVIPLDAAADGFDLAAGTAMKWLLGPPGIGFLYVAPDVLARTGAPQVGYLGAELDPTDPDRVVLRPDARRHELGLPNLLGMPGFAAGLDLILEADVGPISAHVEGLVGRCLDGLTRLGLRATTPSGPPYRAGLISIPVADPYGIQAFLRARSVDVWAHEPPQLIRADPHLFNDTGDIDRFLDGLAAYRRDVGAAGLQPG